MNFFDELHRDAVLWIGILIGLIVLPILWGLTWPVQYFLERALYGERPAGTP